MRLIEESRERLVIHESLACRLAYAARAARSFGEQERNSLVLTEAGGETGVALAGSSRSSLFQKSLLLFSFSCNTANVWRLSGHGDTAFSRLAAAKSANQ